MRWMTFAVVVFGAQVEAGTIYSDGGTHTVNGSSADITVSNDTGLLVQPGANVVGAAPSNSEAEAGITASGAGTYVSMSGGIVSGGTGAAFFDASGTGMVIGPGASLLMSGGVVNGGQGQDGLVDALFGGGFQQMVISNGILNSQDGQALHLFNSAGILNISGGIFNGCDIISISNGSISSISGCTFNGLPNVAITPLPSTFYSSLIEVGVGGMTTISGGLFNGPTPLVFLAQDMSGITISGGQFTLGLAYDLANGGTLTFLGSNLSYSSGRISGTLEDGSAISSLLTNVGSQARVTDDFQ